MSDRLNNNMVYAPFICHHQIGKKKKKTNRRKEEEERSRQVPKVHIDRSQTVDRTLKAGHNKEEVENTHTHKTNSKKKRNTRTIRTNRGILRKYCVLDGCQCIWQIQAATNVIVILTIYRTFGVWANFLFSLFLLFFLDCVFYSISLLLLLMMMVMMFFPIPLPRIHFQTHKKKTRTLSIRFMQFSQ